MPKKENIAENRRFSFRLKGDKSLWALVIVFSLLSLVFVYSSSSRIAVMENTTTFSIMIKQMNFIIAGLVVIFICHLIPLRFYRTMSYIVYLAALVLLLVTLFAGESRNEGTRWISFLGFSFQPSEFAKIALVMFVAKVLEEDKLKSFKDFMIRLVIPSMLFILPIIWEGFSTGSILAFTIFIMLLISNIRFSYIAKAAGIIVLVAGLAYGIYALQRAIRNDGENHLGTSRIETVEKRIMSFIGLGESSGEDETENDQVIYSKVAIATGGVAGKIPGNGTLRHVLPLSNSDYIYSIIVEETGLIGGIFVIGLYFWLLYSVILIAKVCRKVFSSMLVCGLGILIVTQALIHILVNVGLLPVTGQTLPMISSGGSSVLAVSIAFGMMISVSRAIQDEQTGKSENTEVEYSIENQDETK